VSAQAGPYDVLVVGGGVNGAGIARDAAGRGLSVLLVEQHDLAAHTSSASTKLVHGGLRYVEQYEFALVRKALLEREALISAAPHIMWPMRFVMPHDVHLRPAWMIRAGLFLYDHLAPRRYLPASQSVDLREHPAGGPLRGNFTRGFAYSDGWVDDARLVVLNARDAADRGAAIETRTRCTALRREGGHWRATLLRDAGTAASDPQAKSVSDPDFVAARAVVNATGPWVESFLTTSTTVRSAHAVRLVKGSHIVVPRLFEHEFAYLFQNPDQRIVFAIPYEGAFTLIGTTDVEYDGDAAAVAIDAAEVEYLCGAANRYFRRSVAPHDVVWTYSGVRPLLDDESADPSSVTRDYALELDTAGPPLLSVFGGKITTFRRLAEEVVDRLAPLLGCPARPWTAGVALPGGNLPGGDFEGFVHALGARHPWLAPSLRRRLARGYGTRVESLLDGARDLNDLGEAVLPGLHAREIDYLVREEWAHTAADILWRRTKLGLHAPRDGERILDDWLARRREVR
jgi:glycerol-3-phosphate dehydrogenase